jgi:hypothetical protein
MFEAAWLEEPLRQDAEERGARDESDGTLLAFDGHDEDAMMEEDLGECYVREVLFDGDVFRVHVLGNRLIAAGSALFERLVEQPRDEGGVMKLSDVAGEQRRHELALSEQADAASVLVDYGKGRQPTVEQRAHGIGDGVIDADGRRALDPDFSHRYLTAM